MPLLISSMAVRINTFSLLCDNACESVDLCSHLVRELFDIVICSFIYHVVCWFLEDGRNMSKCCVGLTD